MFPGLQRAERRGPRAQGENHLDEHGTRLAGQRCSAQGCVFGDNSAGLQHAAIRRPVPSLVSDVSY